ncbi:MAG: hypothetical protein JW776_06565 [Candidatus Lokiarchaeota archaeon]|nr:hypothetical protein [Candidatus Lokiarchaeota archaeon]
MTEPEKLDAIAKEIALVRNLPYTLKIEKVDGNTYHCRSSWGNHITYIKKDDHYFIETELDKKS